MRGRRRAGVQDELAWERDVEGEGFCGEVVDGELAGAAEWCWWDWAVAGLAGEDLEAGVFGGVGAGEGDGVGGEAGEGTGDGDCEGVGGEGGGGGVGDGDGAGGGRRRGWRSWWWRVKFGVVLVGACDLQGGGAGVGEGDGLLGGSGARGRC